MSRFRWPMHFGLLNADCLWVLDEIQLMGTGLATSTQLQAFRDTLGTFGTVRTIWMSATLLPDWLCSVDFRHRVEGLRTISLDDADYRAVGLQERWEAAKPIQKGETDPAKLAKFVVEKHHTGLLTLVIVNTVERSRTLFDAIRKLYEPKPKGRGKGATTEAPSAPELKLIHSRFRPRERAAWLGWLKGKGDRIVVSTQVVEAGVDLSARTLITELAPWPSLVQRFGRCNRYGEFSPGGVPAQVYWIDVKSADDKQAAPYAKEELDAARARLETIPDVGPQSLSKFFDGLDESARKTLFPFDPRHVIRRKDFIDLFDTTPDLAGNDLDVSRFIRDGDDLDVQVFWRGTEPPKKELRAAEARRLAPRRDELCSVSFVRFRDDFLGKGKVAYRWDSLDGEWSRVNKGNAESVYPGQVFWVTTAEGGYDAQEGWRPVAKWSDLWHRNPDEEDEPKSTEEPSYDSELLSLFGWRSISEHTQDVVEELGAILTALWGEELLPLQSVLLLAARWHDWGKAHAVFQDAIREEADGEPRPPIRVGKRDIAKAAPQKFWRRYDHPHFRHELASALGVLSLMNRGQTPADWRDLDAAYTNLALYLIAAHHGKVRLSIRSMPGEKTPDRLFARGVWQDDELPAVDLGDGVMSPTVTLDLSPMLLGRMDGQPSWAERILRLRDKDFGPLRLAYLEAVLRAADMRASKAAGERAKGGKQ
jgi:CRISPR-associated endonuclease/helicase Cas3